MFIFALFLCALSKNITNPDELVKLYKEGISNTEYQIYTNQTLTLTYESYEGVYAMHLQAKDYDESHAIYGPDDFNLFSDIDSTSGCFSHQRKLEVTNSLSIGLPTLESRFFTDFVAIPHLNRVFMVRNDYHIFQVDVQLDASLDHISQIQQSPSEYFSFMELLSNKTRWNPLGFSHPFMVYNQKSEWIYVITNYGCVKFLSTSDIISNEIKVISAQENFIFRDRIEDVFFNNYHQVVLVAAGTDGIDVYSINEDHDLQYTRTITATDLNLVSINVVDISCSEDGKELYILDQSFGFHIVDIQQISFPVKEFLFIQFQIKLDFNLPISRGIAFDFKHQTFIFIAQKVNLQDYAFEVFIDFVQNSFYINRIFEDQMDLFDVVVFEHYAVLIGSDAHKLIYHSIYKGFVDSKLEHQSLFREPELQKIAEYSWVDQKEHHQLIGLGEYEFKTFKVESYKPIVRCHSDKYFKSVFLLQMNSTNCNQKAYHQDHSQFSQCLISHPFTFTVEEIFLTTTYKIWILVGAIVGGVLLFFLCGTICICYKRWKNEISGLEKRIRGLKVEVYGHLTDHEKQQEDEIKPKILIESNQPQEEGQRGSQNE